MIPPPQDPPDAQDPTPPAGEQLARDAAEAHLREIGEHHSQLFPGTAAQIPTSFYGPLPDEPCWVFHVDEWSKRGVIALDSTRLLFVSKLSGRVVFDGKAGDEG